MINLKDAHNALWLKYHKKIDIKIVGDEFYSYIELNQIFIPEKTKHKQTEWSLFAFLHEIGHITTNKVEMRRYEKEYLATQWALEETKKMDFKVPKWIIDEYQKYIYEWRETSIKRGDKNVVSKKQLVLKY